MQRIASMVGVGLVLGGLLAGPARAFSIEDASSTLVPCDGEFLCSSTAAVLQETHGGIGGTATFTLPIAQPDPAAWRPIEATLFSIVATGARFTLPAEYVDAMFGTVGPSIVITDESGRTITGPRANSLAPQCAPTTTGPTVGCSDGNGGPPQWLHFAADDLEWMDDTLRATWILESVDRIPQSATDIQSSFYFTIGLDVVYAPVPEGATGLLFGFGLAGLALSRSAARGTGRPCPRTATGAGHRARG